MAYDIGEKPGEGTYQCIYSQHTVTLPKDTDPLPPCPSNKCTDNYPDTQWIKV
jgi:hypothetical protein